MLVSRVKYSICNTCNNEMLLRAVSDFLQWIWYSLSEGVICSYSGDFRTQFHWMQQIHWIMISCSALLYLYISTLECCYPHWGLCLTPSTGAWARCQVCNILMWVWNQVGCQECNIGLQCTWRHFEPPTQYAWMHAYWCVHAYFL